MDLLNLLNFLQQIRSQLISMLIFAIKEGSPNYIEDLKIKNIRIITMYKPKNISIKKLTQQQQHLLTEQSRRNSRKSLNTVKREVVSKNASPAHMMMKKKTYGEDEECDSSTDQANFIACINGYLNTLDSGKGSRRDNDIAGIKQKIKKQKQINRTLQKNIIEFQRILWERTHKLECLEESVRRIEDKQNRMAMGNSHAKSSAKVASKQYGFSANSEYQFGDSDPSERSQLNQNHYRERRKTELPAEIQKMISQTMGMRSKKLIRN